MGMKAGNFSRLHQKPGNSLTGFRFCDTLRLQSIAVRTGRKAFSLPVQSVVSGTKPEKVVCTDVSLILRSDLSVSVGTIQAVFVNRNRYYHIF